MCDKTLQQSESLDLKQNFSLNSTHKCFFLCVCMRLFTSIIMNGYYISVTHDTQSDYTHFLCVVANVWGPQLKKVRWHPLKIWALSHEAVVFLLSVSFLIRKHQTLLISHVVDPKVFCFFFKKKSFGKISTNHGHSILVGGTDIGQYIHISKSCNVNFVGLPR